MTIRQVEIYPDLKSKSELLRSLLNAETRTFVFPALPPLHPHPTATLALYNTGKRGS
jgi:hypothetical protein